jgi:predicted transcriptional regulator
MAQLPFELQKLPPSALDVLRYFATNDNSPADDVDIMDGADLSERSFSKAIKRLVTKKFAEMDSSRMYTLTEKGNGLMRELIKYDEESGGTARAESNPVESTPVVALAPIQRRMVVVVPEPLLSGEETQVYVGVNEGLSNGTADVMVRLSCLNAEPDEQRQAISIAQGAAYTSFKVTAGEYTQMRLRIEALQMDAFSGDFSPVGGMYVDVDVTKNENEDGQLAAFGTDVNVLPG